MKEYLQKKRLQWFGHVEILEESTRFSKCKVYKVNGGVN